jgi:PAS domain S-box-containing protein
VVEKEADKNIARWRQSPWAIAGLTLVLGILVSTKLALIDADHRLNNARSKAISELATVRARLEGAVNSVFSATSGLVNVISYQGEITPDLFNSLAAQAIKAHPHIRNIAIAPDNIITMIYPLAGNERVIGLHYSNLAEQYQSVLQAMQTGHPVLDGPVRLYQGGHALILRAPVFTQRDVQSGNATHYWGVVSIVANVDAILDAGGIRSAPDLEIGLRRESVSGTPGSMIWGNGSIFARNPVSMQITIPSGEWRIAAIPKGGWPQSLIASPVLYAGLVNSLLLAGFFWGLASRHRQVKGENRELLREIEERTRAEEQLRLSQQKYLNLFHLMPDMVGITSLDDGRLIEVNSGFEKWTGWKASEAIGRSTLDLGLWDAETRAQAVTILRETGRLEDYEFVMVAKSGEKRSALMYLTPIRVMEEECLFFLVHDITALKRAQIVLENERSRLRILLQTIPALFWLKDPEGVYLACNTRFERFFCARESDILGKTDYDFVDKELADFFRENDLKAIAADGPSVNEEWVTYADDGHRELLETIKTPVRNAEGGLIGVLGIARDITEHRRTDDELKNERLRFKNLVDSVDGIVWELDIETFTFTYVSQQAVRLLGYPLEEWYRPGFWLAHLHSEDAEWAPAYCSSCTSRREDHDFEYRFIAQDGRTVWLHDIVTVVEEEGQPRWLRGIMVDTTGKKLEEAEKHKLEIQLRQAQKMEAIGRLAGGVAHDFNNKLAIILGYAEMAARADSGSERYRRCLEQIIRAAGQSRDITRQLLAFSRQEMTSPRVIDLNDVVRDSQQGLCRFIGEDIRFEVKLAEKLWPINIDPAQVDQIIMNLVVNARDAMEDGGLLVIETSNVSIDKSFTSNSEITLGDYVQLTVSDTGCGMDRETQQHIFEPFYTTKEAGKGTGLGLATIYGIVSQNRGIVNVYSEPGTGSTFRIYFPRSDEQKSSPEVDAEPTPQLDLPATILLVEDDDTVRELTAEILEEFGYTVLVAANPQQAIDLCSMNPRPIDLLLSDVIMPEMNGKELSRRIETLQPGLRVLFMSGYTAEVIDQKGMLGEGLHFIQKPFDSASLHDKIRKVLNETA